MSRNTIKVSAAVVVAAAALAGCGSGGPEAGAAAIVGGDRISISTLGQTVEDANREFEADPVANLLRGREKDWRPAAQGTLFQILLIRVTDEAARRAGINLTAGLGDMALANLNADLGRERVNAVSYTRALGLPSRYARDVARREFLDTELARRYPDQQQAKQLLGETFRGLKIKLNPRYGSFDPDQMQFGPSKTLLSRPETGIG